VSTSSKLRVVVGMMLALLYFAAGVHLMFGSCESMHLPLPPLFSAEQRDCFENPMCLGAYFPIFFVGTCIGLHWRSTVSRWCTAYSSWLNAVAPFLLVALVLTPDELRWRHDLFVPWILCADTSTPTNFLQTHGQSRYSFIFLDPYNWFVVYGLLICSAHSASSTRVLSSKILSTYGKMSFGLYVYHPAVFFFTSQQFGKGLLQLIGAFVAVTTLAWLSFFYFELPLMILIRSYFRNVETRISSLV